MKDVVITADCEVWDEHGDAVVQQFKDTCKRHRAAGPTLDSDVVVQQFKDTCKGYHDVRVLTPKALETLGLWKRCLLFC